MTRVASTVLWCCTGQATLAKHWGRVKEEEERVGRRKKREEREERGRRKEREMRVKGI